MNAAVTIMQITDWSKYCLEDWLYQFGAWMHSNSGTCGKSIKGKGVKADDKYTIPLCHICHRWFDGYFQLTREQSKDWFAKMLERTELMMHKNEDVF